MTIKEAWEKSKVKVKFGKNGHMFAEVKWTSPSTGKSTRGILVTIDGDRAIEIGWDGRFIDTFPAVAEYYSPIDIRSDSGKDKYIKELIKKLENTLKKG